MSKYLITGAAGFIGFHLANALLKKGEDVVGLDNINDYYNVDLKFARLNEAGIKKVDVDWGKFASSLKYPNYRFIRQNLENKNGILKLFEQEKFDYVIHLAAQAGVRYSIDHPEAYIQSNIIGFFNILEACRYYPVNYLIYASSSSVYGNNEKVPFCEDDNVDNPISLYAATKKTNELMASTYSHLYGLNAVGLRFFTVYGPWGRPDMAIFKFTESILNNRPIQVYSHGDIMRDFTFIDDIILGIILVLNRIKIIKPPFILNIGNNKPVSINHVVSILEKYLNKKANIEYCPMQPGDVEITNADTQKIYDYCNFKPTTSIESGLSSFCIWYYNHL